MNEFQKKVQTLLMRKGQEYGEVKFLNSRATEESTRKIDDISSSIVEIFRTCNVPIEIDDPVARKECIEAFKYLLLNTHLESQDRLAEDVTNGHLVDVCPPLSTYLFMQILWSVKYEKVLAKSFLYLPLDLCVELLEVTRKYLGELPFERSIDIIYEVVENVYYNFIRSKETGVQTADLRTTRELLVTNFQEFLLLLTNPRIIRLDELTGLKRYERHGIVFKRLIGTVRNCIERTESRTSLFGGDLEKLYKLTFGRESYVKHESNTSMQDAVARFENELLCTLLKKIKEIDCNVYLGWAELDDTEKRRKRKKEISLQRSIGNDCYQLLKYLEKDDRFREDTHLLECLQQLASKPDHKRSGHVLTLEELREAIKDGKKECKKELMSRYREWDQPTLVFIKENRALLDKDDCIELLEFLTFTRRRSSKKEWRNFSYNLVMRILFLRSIPEIYEIVMEYITKHNGQNHLELKYTQECFQEFIRLNSNLRTPSNLRTILLFLLRNPKMVLTTLVKITIGHPDYQNILVAPKDLCLLSPFLSIREEPDQTLITTVFRTVCMENPNWNPTKFLAFIHAMLNKRVFRVDDLFNNVFIPYLEAENFQVWNLISILANIRFLRWGSTRSTDVRRLSIALARKMTRVRRDNTLSKYKSSEIIHHVTKILEHFLDTKGSRISNEAKSEIVAELEAIIEPVDKIHFAPLSYFTRMGITLVDVVQDYKRRCSIVLNELKGSPECPERLRASVSDLTFLGEDFLRHLVCCSTEDEYHQFALEFSTIYCFVFGCNDEIEAYVNFLRLTMEACCLLCQYPTLAPRDSSVYLIKCVLKFTETFVKIEGLGDVDRVYLSLIEQLSSLEPIVKNGPYSTFFIAFFTHFLGTSRPRSPEILQELNSMVDSFLQQCSKSRIEDSTTSISPNSRSHESTSVNQSSERIARHLRIHRIISACVKVPAAESSECIRRMDDVFAQR